jgi:hypothetical protein
MSGFGLRSRDVELEGGDLDGGEGRSTTNFYH